ncbi:MAG: CPBP family intramembrane metalloprotease [Lachnospiraceae bacterium]|nr:CPBP family intramembrane metalloprotease [Lachnospiraceae bacterium]
MNDNQKQIRLYLLLTLGTCFLLGMAAFFTQSNRENAAYQILQKGFTAFPVTAAILTRRITKDKTKWRFSLKLWKNPVLWAFCAFVPAILIAMGSVLYFLFFPAQYSGVFDISSLAGIDAVIQIRNPFFFCAVCVLIAAFCIPLQLLELGEEIGWREYLLPKQIAQYGLKKGILLNGFCWGLAHMPLIYFGFNYSSENIGAPWSNMAMMMLACMTIGTICSCVMVISNNVMYSAIIHGAVNVIGEIPVFISVSHKSGLLGPNPTGIISMSGLVLCAVIMLMRLND